MRKFPFMLNWPNGSVKHELVFAASTTSDRAAWANALKDGINRAKTGAPTAGWLYKEGVLSGFKRRWFELHDFPLRLEYYLSPKDLEARAPSVTLTLALALT